MKFRPYMTFLQFASLLSCLFLLVLLMRVFLCRMSCKLLAHMVATFCLAVSDLLSDAHFLYDCSVVRSV